MMSEIDRMALRWAANVLEGEYSGNIYMKHVQRMAEASDKIPDMVRDAEDFHEKFGLAYRGPPRRLPRELDGFRVRFMLEELREYETSANLAGQLDALVDLVYVALGTAHLHGFNFREAWRRVHAANMQKVRGPSDRSQEYDVVKPEGWRHPDLSDLVVLG